ncbi:MAG: glycosyltransferase [Clostridia bacterium]|nr:glycosyltransferase [Clostridia bacterium]
MARYRICVVGRFNRDNACDGQTIKTIEVVEELVKKYGEKNVRQTCYAKIRDNKPKLLMALLGSFATSEVVMVAANSTGVGNLLKVCTLINKIFRRKLYFMLVGAALHEEIDQNPAALPILKQCKGILLETETLKKALIDRGLDNLYIIPNFKKLRRFTLDEQPTEFSKPYKLIYMSRIVGLKGVTEMIRELKRINENEVKFTLDMYGLIWPDYAEEFEALRADFPDYIKYHGICDAWKTTEVIHDYFLQLFPTKCPTEGQPASIIDSFFAGTPVLSGRWNSCHDMLREGETGISFPLEDFDAFREKLEYCYDHPEEVMAMREHCVREAELFMPEKVIEDLAKILDGEK